MFTDTRFTWLAATKNLLMEFLIVFFFIQNENTDLEIYSTMSLKAYSTGQRLSEPVRVPGTPEVFDRSYILEKITGKLAPSCLLNPHLNSLPHP